MPGPGLGEGEHGRQYNAVSRQRGDVRAPLQNADSVGVHEVNVPSVEFVALVPPVRVVEFVRLAHDSGDVLERSRAVLH